MGQSDTKIVLLPKSHPDPTTWTRIIAHQKSLRLQALQISPEAFSSTYEREVAFTDAHWEERLQKPFAHSFVAYNEPKNPESNVDNAVAAGNWVGLTALIGPLHELSEYLQRPTEGVDGEDWGSDKVPVYELCSIFVLPEFRGQGLGRDMVAMALAHASKLGEEKGADEVVVRISCAADNASTLRLYDSWGFARVGQLTAPQRDWVLFKKTVAKRRGFYFQNHGGENGTRELEQHQEHDGEAKDGEDKVNDNLDWVVVSETS